MPGMYVSWGSFDFKTWEAGISLRVNLGYSNRGFPSHSDVNFQIDGEICEGSELATKTRLEEIRDAFNYNYQDIVYRHSDGTPSVHSLANNDPSNMTGNHIKFANYPSTTEGEFVSGRKFSIGIAARLKLNGFSNVLEYADAIRFTGNGGPVWEWFYDKWTGFYSEMVSPDSPQMIVHRGHKITSNTWHWPASPFFQPPFEDNSRRVVDLKSPIVYPNGMTEFRTDWEYHYLIPGASADFLRPRTGYL